MNKLIPLALLLLLAISSSAQSPNIVFILADDMGIGDVSHHGGLAPTPAIDRLAKEGMRFTDAHSTSSVCTPTRYGVLTGRYNWRTRLKKSVFFNPHDKPLIEAGEVTVASLLKEQGYNTACVGKWHLGIGWQFLENPVIDKKIQKGQGWDIDYSKPAITPTSHGFDFFYGIQASLDMAPYLYIKNDKAVEPGTVTKAFNRPGAASADFEANQCLITFARESVSFIEQQKADKPFFLYLPLTSPHTPIVPSEAWKGKSSIGSYGDFLMETDWVVGEVLKVLDKKKFADNTLIVFSTDNGCSPAAKIPHLEEQGHIPNGKQRGHKADIYEGGHRVPFIVRWPGKVPPGSTTDRLTCQTDFIATCADVLDAELPAHAAVDGVSFKSTLLGKTEARGIPVVHHSIDGAFAIRDGKWKLCLCPGSGGWSTPRRGKEAANAPRTQLFDLDADPLESNNLVNQHPEIAERLTKQMQAFVDNGRSTPGEKQPLVGKTDIFTGSPKATPKKKKGK